MSMTTIEDGTTQMHAEAAEAPGVIAHQLQRNHVLVSGLAERLRREPPRFVVTCARGSSDHAATYAKHLFETRCGVLTASASPSVGSVYEVPQRLDGVLYVLVSQSGRSPDLLRNAEAARNAGAQVVALVNAPDSPLGALADVEIPLHAGPERSVAATKSYLASLAALLQLAAYWSDDPMLQASLRLLPDALGAAWEQDWSPLVDGLAEARNLYVLGRGPGLSAAQESALKFKETCGLHAEAFSSAEVRHGPMALVGPGFPVLCFSQADVTEAGTLATAREFRARGARVWVASEQGDLRTGHAPHAACAPLLAVQSFYRAANALAVLRGFDPDVPPYLNKVTETV